MLTKLMLAGGHKIWLRVGKGEPSSDEQAANEVLVKMAYRRARSGFDVLPGEHWLDLGANIGAFAVYCRSKNATATCIEPEQDCLRLLKRNAPGFLCFPYALTASKELTLDFVKSSNPQNNYRGTVLPVRGYAPHDPVLNMYAGQAEKFLGRWRFDGVKMDIEGSEGELIDEWLLPRCSKLVMEYHTSRDPSVKNLARRLKILKDHFKNVTYPKAYDDAIAGKESEYRPRFDQLIFCWGE